MSGLPFVANLSYVSLDERVDLLYIYFAGLVVADLSSKRESSFNCIIFVVTSRAYLRYSLPENFLVFFLCDILFVVMRLQD